MWLLREISLPHLSGHKARTALTIVGIAIGIGAILATTTVTDAVFASFRRMVAATAGQAELHVSNGSAGVPEDLLARIRETPGVAGAAALVEGVLSTAGPRPESLTVFGLDLLGDTEHDAQIPRDAVHVADPLLFVSQADSVALTETLLAARGLGPDSALEVVTPRGTRRLVVRGTVDAVGPAALFGGHVALMDLPAAQRLLVKEEKVDRIDVRLAPDADRDEVSARLAALVDGTGRVRDTTAAGAKVEDLLLSLRVSLALAGLIAGVVGFFIIYHTVSVSIVQRRREIALLNALGMSGRALLLWLAGEALVLTAIAAVLGTGIGVLLARVSVATFATVATAWVHLPPAAVTLSATGIATAVGVGALTTLVATVIPAWALVAAPGARQLRLVAAPAGATRSTVRALAFAGVGLAVTWALVSVAPRTASYVPLVGYIFTLNSLALVSFALLSPALALGFGVLAGRMSERRPGIGMFLAAQTVARTPAAPAAVVAAIVMGLGWTLAQSSLTTSFEYSWFRWLEEHYRSDLVVNAGTTSVSLLTYPPVAEEVADEIRALPGVVEVQGLRTVEIDYQGRPAVILAVDRSEQHGLPAIDVPWAAVAGKFWMGEGVLVSENLAHKTGLRTGETVELPTPEGAFRLPVLGIFADFQSGGDLGCVALSRPLFRDRWRDHLLTRLLVWTAPGTTGDVRATIEETFGPTHGVYALTFAAARAGVAELVRSAFAICHALVLIALVVSFVGVLNFLLAAVLDRGPELRVLGALGVSARQITATITSEGAIIGGVGAAIGLVAGVVMSRLIVLHSVPMVNGWHFTWRFPVSTAVLLGTMVIALSAAAGLLPARLATRRVRAREVVE